MWFKGAVTITGHFERPKVRRLAQKTAKILHNLGVESIIASIKKKRFNSKKTVLVIVVGGDGTMLRVVRELKRAVPVIGIAAGERSALMTIKPEKLGGALKKIATGKFRVEKRMHLQVFADGKKLPLALNEAMLVNSISGGIVQYCLRINGKKIYCKKADGCIIATPTGSTGHAYSAGGKKISLSSNKIAIVPSNPLYREAKPVYTSGNSNIVLDGFANRQCYEVVLDGQPRFAVRRRLSIRKGKDVLFIKA